MDQPYVNADENFSPGENHSIVIYNRIYSNNSITEYDPSFLLPHLTQTQERHWPMAWTILDFLNHYYIPFIFVVGVVGNSISCLVFLCTHLRIRSSSYYLAALAVADVAFLLTLFLVWLASMGVEVFNQNGWCQIVVYLSSVSSFLSVWCIIAFTVERFIAIQYPLQRPQMCTVKRAKIIVCALSVFAFVAHSYLLCVAGMVASEADEEVEMVENTVYVCGLLPSFYGAMKVINSVDTVVTLILPVLLILCMNTLIARQLYQFSRKYRNNATHAGCALSTTASGSTNPHRCGEHSSNEQNGGNSSQSGHSASRSHNNNNSSNNSNCAGVMIGKGRELNSDARRPPSNRSILSQRTQYTITKMLLLISTVFVLLNLPSYVFRLYLFVGDHQADAGATSSPVTNEFAFIVQQFSMLLYYSNFSVNFLLYSMYGMTFRRALTQLARTRLHLTRVWKTRSDSFQFK